MRSALSEKSEYDESHAAVRLNCEMGQLRNELKAISQQSQKLCDQGTQDEQQFQQLLKKSKQLKAQLQEKENAFKEMMREEEEEPFAFMHETEITLERLITDYASSNFLYLIPPEMAKMQLHLCSSSMIPKASWEEIIEIICLQNGIGIKSVNTFVKSLYWNLGNHSQSLKHILSGAQELELIGPHEQVCFVLPMNGSELTKVHTFLKRFINERMTSLHMVGNNLLIVGECTEVKELTKLVDFVRVHQQDKSYKLVQVDKISKEDVEAILLACFSQEKSDPKNASQDQALTILPIRESLLLIGSDQDLEKASRILDDICSQVSSPDQMTLYWYMCKYSDPADLALLLQQVYQMIAYKVADPELDELGRPKPPSDKPVCNPREGTIPPICEMPNLVVNPKSAPPPSEFGTNESLPNFIVDGKTGYIIMVVKQAYLDQLKGLVKKLDVPKKMVELEVLLFEKKIKDQTQFGLNLLKLGDNVKKNEAYLDWRVSTSDRSAPGILDYFFSRKNPGGSFPAFNFAYNFLISQEDICVHSNPTITTMNQTQAVIDLVEEQSINMGTVENPQTSTTSNTFVRAQYGIIIQITPTINFGDEENDFNHFVTLETDIIFDTTTSDKNNRPDVSRRHIQNQVRIADGETLILGGLRRKNSETNVDKIPFLGDIPGLGKLFSFTTLDDMSTEMFILITPRIVEDPQYLSDQYKIQDLKKRPGDSRELLKKLLEAKQIHKALQHKSTLQKLFSYENIYDF